jgi:hypothetical protein
MNRYYKLARPDGFDFHTGRTINYRESIGKTVKCPKPKRHFENWLKTTDLCSDTVLHACVNPNDCFVAAKMPCSAYIVEGKPVVKDENKCGFKKFFVVEEIPQENLDEVFGWKYSETCDPLNPFKIRAPRMITNVQIDLLRNWASVRGSVWASVGDSVWASVWASVRDSVWASVGASVWASVRDSVGASVWASVWASVRDSVWASVRDSEAAYIGTLFPSIKKWQYINHDEGIYPYQSCIDLLRQGLVPSYEREKWRLHAGPDGHVVYEVARTDLK